MLPPILPPDLSDVTDALLGEGMPLLVKALMAPLLPERLVVTDRLDLPVRLVLAVWAGEEARLLLLETERDEARARLAERETSLRHLESSAPQQAAKLQALESSARAAESEPSCS